MAVILNGKTVGGALGAIESQKNIANGVAGLDSSGNLVAYGATSNIQFNDAGVFAGSANLTYTETGSLGGGPELTVGSGAAGSVGWIWGSHSSGISGMWGTDSVPSSINYVLAKSGTTTFFNGAVLRFNISGNLKQQFELGKQSLVSDMLFGWSNSAINADTLDSAFSRESAGLLQINSGTANTYRDLKVRKHYVDQTITPAGTTGAQTINKAAGTVNFAADATSLVVTNSLVTTSSSVFCVIRTADATATIKNVVPVAGSFTITLGAATTAETSVGFHVIN